MEGDSKEIENFKVGLNKGYIIRLAVFAAGLFTLALGAAIVITADVGVATWDVLHIGLSDITGLTVGRWVQIVGVGMVAITAFFEKKRIAVGSVLNIVLIGFFLNAILGTGLLPEFRGLAPRIIMLLIGIVFMGSGSGMYVASGIGAGPRDGMTLLIARRFSISVRLARTLLEMAALTCGWLVGGPVALGTFVTVPLLGPIMQSSLKFSNRQLEKLYKDDMDGEA
ncbi:hypothetical protein EUAN_01500 [Andreesenia angusta]|uniref:BCR, YitT family n=1 Tax=Andreesenia angusta TaxID=39480 RepID=A0A1S1V9K8_9FIRM|nr:membrane protein [Andreesenia angusta]OHW63286.1 hypothetical protein EUAN_01500 [Andreesenia angusta]